MADKLLTIGEVVEKIKSGDLELAELAGELANADASFARDDRSFDCRLCGNHYMPAQGQWIFYNFCDKCFTEFNLQKMRGRFRGFPTQIDPNSDPKAAAHIGEMIERFSGGSVDEFYTESFDEWLKAKKEQNQS